MWRPWLLVLLIAGILAFAWYRIVYLPRASSPSTPLAPVEPLSLRGGYRLPVKVVHVVDGDTAGCEIFHGCGIKSYRRVRILGIDAPEMNTQAGKDCKAAATAFAAGKDGWLVFEKDQTDSFGRVLGELEVGGRLWSAEMLKSGAIPYEGR